MFSRPLKLEDRKDFLSHFEELPGGEWRVAKPFGQSGYPFIDTADMRQGRLIDENSDFSGFLNSDYLTAVKRSLPKD